MYVYTNSFYTNVQRERNQYIFQNTNILWTHQHYVDFKTHVFSGTLRTGSASIERIQRFSNPKASFVFSISFQNVMYTNNNVMFTLSMNIWLFIYLVSMYAIGCGIQCSSTLRLFRHYGLGVWQIGIRAIVYSELSIFFQENYNYRHGDYILWLSLWCLQNTYTRIISTLQNPQLQFKSLSKHYGSTRLWVLSNRRET